MSSLFRNDFSTRLTAESLIRKTRVDAAANVALRFFTPVETGLLGIYGTNLRRWYSSGSIFGAKWQDLAGQHDADVGIFGAIFSPSTATINGNLAPHFDPANPNGLVAGIGSLVDALAAEPFVDQAVFGCVFQTSAVGDPTYGSIIVGQFFNGEEFALHINLSGFLEAWVNTSTGAATSNAAVTDGLPHTSWATWNGATGVVTLYVDGVAQTTTQTGVLGPLVIGNIGDDVNLGCGTTSDGNAPYAFYDGKMTEVFIANVLPTAAQLTATQLYLRGIAGLGAYTLTAAAGAFLETGQAATLRTSLVCAAGSFALTGQAATLNASIVCAAGSFLQTGQAATLRTSLVCSPGAFLETGSAASLVHGYKLAMAAGAFLETGQAATLRTSLVCAAGSFALTGQAATLRTSLVCTAGSFLEAGSAASFVHGYRLTAAAGAFALTGDAATLAKQWRLSFAAGAFLQTGQAATLNASIVCAAGGFLETGSAAALVHGYRLTAAAGAFLETGQAATLRTSLVCTAGSFTLAGQAATLNASIVCATGSFLLTGQPCVLNGTIVCAAGSFALTGKAATLVYTPVGNPVLVAAVGSFALTGQAATLNAGIVCAAGSFLQTGSAATLRTALVCSTGSFSTTGQAASMVHGYVLALAAAAAFVLTGQAATMRTSFACSAGSFTSTGSDAVLGVAIRAEPSELDLTGRPATFVYVAVHHLVADVGAFSIAGDDASFGRGFVVDFQASPSSSFVGEAAVSANSDSSLELRAVPSGWFTGSARVTG